MKKQLRRIKFWLKVIAVLIFIHLAFMATCVGIYGQSATLDNIDTIYIENTRAGSCSSPNGAATVIASPPPSYAYLLANGYCYLSAYGNNPTTCWTFTPTSTSVTLNSGYQTSGCFSISFNSFQLYNSSCVLIGTGLTFTGLTPGTQYTWCFTGVASGFFCTGFSSFCPYYMNNVVLPISLLTFDGFYENNVVTLDWSTASETNNNYFVIEKMEDNFGVKEIGRVEGSGNSNEIKQYSFIDLHPSEGINYYRLVQYDINGDSKTYDWISVLVPDNNNKCCKEYFDLLGKSIDFGTAPSGIYIGLTENGNIIKIKK